MCVLILQVVDSKIVYGNKAFESTKPNISALKNKHLILCHSDANVPLFPTL